MRQNVTLDEWLKSREGTISPADLPLIELASAELHQTIADELDKKQIYGEQNCACTTRDRFRVSRERRIQWVEDPDEIRVVRH